MGKLRVYFWNKESNREKVINSVVIRSSGAVISVQEFSIDYATHLGGREVCGLHVRGVEHERQRRALGRLAQRAPHELGRRERQRAVHRRHQVLHAVARLQG